MKTKLFFANLGAIAFYMFLSCGKNPTESTFQTPSVITVEANEVTTTTALCGGTITSDGGATIITRGVCWSTLPTPTLSDYKTNNGTGIGNFTSFMTGLMSKTTYYVRAYATNRKGTGFGSTISFTTMDLSHPVVTTAAVSAVTNATAQCGGTIISNGGSPITARGVCWRTSPTPTISSHKTIDGTGAGSFTSTITGLSAETTYYVRAYATNSIGTGYGSTMTFTTLAPSIPVVTTITPSAVANTSARCGGKIISDGGATIITRGVCWSTDHTPTVSDSTTSDGTGAGSYSSLITSLIPETTYYVRAYATNSEGTAYGFTMSFTTPARVVDIDGNQYNTVIIGAKLWMAENLKVTRYRNGDEIPNVTDNTEWYTLTNGACCCYANLASHIPIYGLLYNWYAVNDSRTIAPEGWHVPTYDEWRTLVNYLGGSDVAGAKMKETGVSHWRAYNDATNESGFTARPGGCRYDGSFLYRNLHAFFWTATERDSLSAFRLALIWCNDWVQYYYFRYHCGCSVRCVKD